MENINFDSSISRLLLSLKELQLENNDKDLLQRLLQSRQVHALVEVHNILSDEVNESKFCPMLSNVMQVAVEVLELLSEITSVNKAYLELLELVQKPHFQAILCTHDAVAKKEYFTNSCHSVSVTQNIDIQETIKIVQLVKSDEPLGATIKTDDVTGKIVIARVMLGGAADRSGLINPGDEVIEVNGVCVLNKTPTDVLDILQKSESTITFKLVPSYDSGETKESKLRVRALFDYNAEEDTQIPCREAGLSFKKGDVLHIVNQDDIHWWQARREGDKSVRAGLIPSRALQERRIIQQRLSDPLTLDGNQLCSATANTDCTPKTPCSPQPTTTALLPCKSVPKVKKVIYDITENDDFDRETVPTYEEVARLYPRPGRVRPIVLVGAAGVGRNELRRRLLATDPDKFITPVPYTTRAQKASEQSGKEYIYITREDMEQEISDGKFIEHGEYKGNLYGTSAESVEAIINTGRICVLSPHWQALKMLRTPRLNPYIIFVRPPSLNRLIASRSAAHARSSFDKESSRAFTEEEFAEIIRSSNRINYLYGHLFDEEIVNEDLGAAVSQLIRASWRMQLEPMWVPASWV